jgi:AraC-like DNA-binding protein
MNVMGRRKKKQENIPLHTAELADSAGFRMGYLDTVNDWETAAAMEAHRDDHYVFFVQTTGYTEVMLDFQTLRLEGLSAGYIRPGQIHHYHGGFSAGYFLAVDPSLLDNHCLTILEYEPASHQTVTITESDPILQCIQLLRTTCDRSIGHPVQLNAQRALVQAFTGLLAAAITEQHTRNTKPQGRANNILVEFRKLVKQHFLMARSAGQYALMLNISTAYLNEVVKQLTGFTASYWIQQEILLEARRLLVHTDLSAKEIAYRTGYDDPTYFSRLFKKVSGCSPLDFRARHHELSNQIP